MNEILQEGRENVDSFPRSPLVPLPNMYDFFFTKSSRTAETAQPGPPGDQYLLSEGTLLPRQAPNPLGRMSETIGF